MAGRWGVYTVYQRDRGMTHNTHHHHPLRQHAIVTTSALATPHQSLEVPVKTSSNISIVFIDFNAAKSWRLCYREKNILFFNFLLLWEFSSFCRHANNSWNLARLKPAACTQLRANEQVPLAVSCRSFFSEFCFLFCFFVLFFVLFFCFFFVLFLVLFFCFVFVCFSNTQLYKNFHKLLV